MTACRIILVLALAFVHLSLGGSGLVNAADGPAPEGVLIDARAEGRDCSALLRWRFNDQKVREYAIKGVKVYRIVSGDESGFNVKPLKLLQDCALGTEYLAKGLENGFLYNFVLKLYGDKGELQSAHVLPALPGKPVKGAPSAVQHLYQTAGPTAVSVFWAPSSETSVEGYEVSRKSGEETGYTVLTRVPKVAAINYPAKDKASGSHLPALRPCFHRDATVKPGVSYSYRIRPFDSQGNFGAEAVSAPVQTQPSRSPEADEVLLLAVAGDEESLAVARHYALKRKVPQSNILQLKLPKAGHLFRCEEHAAKPVREYLLAKGVAGKIRVIVSCFGFPLGDGRRSVDSILTDPFRYYTWGRVMGTDNPLFNSNANFDGTTGLYLVARVDGPDKKTAMSLVDKAVAVEKSIMPSSGSAYFVSDDTGRKASVAAQKYGVSSVVEPQQAYKNLTLPDNAMWMFGGGSPARRLRTSNWPAGSVAAVLKSDSCMEVRDPKARSWVHSLLDEGVTATFGSVVEPYVQGFTRGDIFFDRFWSGKYTFAEAFLMATPTVRWNMTAVGDPLFKLGKHQTTD